MQNRVHKERCKALRKGEVNNGKTHYDTGDDV